MTTEPKTISELKGARKAIKYQLKENWNSDRVIKLILFVCASIAIIFVLGPF
ncbi:MAG: hypothetical protein P8Y97_13730 [Candidatus Lokiarchaeota archaeon]